MGVQERREREKKEQRQRILDAALDIITANGFAALSMRKLADRIEYSAASIYLYFESREQIAQELSEVAFGKLLRALVDAAAATDAVQALEATGLAYVTYGLENPQLYRLIFMSDADYMTAAFRNQSEPNVGMRAYGTLLDLAKRLQSAGILTRPPMVEVAELIWMTLHGIVSLQITCVGMKLASPERLARLATRTLAGQVETKIKSDVSAPSRTLRKINKPGKTNKLDKRSKPDKISKQGQPKKGRVLSNSWI